ncbi:unnamed protein product [Eruca vesicaria subsp. sativa]|uniref:Uncharacterized protein n=1 Tax=Eruca vesicaria subsp. sativa TaxID=29727 RepID=A0ABC8LBA8_ERUVS|nr:unnamed protein product [Eruca vesicaria subsp. sativa]
MATVPEAEESGLRTVVEEDNEHELKKLATSFLGLSFSVMLAHLPSDALSLVPRLTTEVTELKQRLAAAEEQVRQMKCRRVEDSKANARVVEIFASNRNAWQEEEKRLQNRIHELEEEREEFMNRRESPWKIDSEATGVSAKLRLLEEELLNLEKVCTSDISKVLSLLRKQAKRYQALAGKIDDLCRKMQSSDPCDATLGPEFRTQRQTEFLLECFRFQQRASETGQKLVALQTEITRSNQGDQLSLAKMNTRRSMDLIKNNLKQVQRNLEIWLARIIGDLEGILARDGASRVREFYVARYPFVQ